MTQDLTQASVLFIDAEIFARARSSLLSRPVYLRWVAENRTVCKIQTTANAMAYVQRYNAMASSVVWRFAPCVSVLSGRMSGER